MAPPFLKCPFGRVRCGDRCRILGSMVGSISGLGRWAAEAVRGPSGVGWKSGWSTSCGTPSCQGRSATIETRKNIGTQKAPHRLPPWRSARVRWVVVSGSALEHLRSTGTLLPCSDATERRATKNGVELDAVVVHHVVLLVLQGPLVWPRVDRSVRGTNPYLRHPMGLGGVCQYPNRDPSMVPRLPPTGTCERLTAPDPREKMRCIDTFLITGGSGIPDRR